jgi:hypothetical protein
MINELNNIIQEFKILNKNDLFADFIFYRKEQFKLHQKNSYEEMKEFFTGKKSISNKKLVTEDLPF